MKLGRFFSRFLDKSSRALLGLYGLFFIVACFLDKTKEFATFQYSPKPEPRGTDFTNFGPTQLIPIAFGYLITFFLGAVLWQKILIRLDGLWARFGAAFLLGYISILFFLRTIGFWAGAPLLFWICLHLVVFLSILNRQALRSLFLFSPAQKARFPLEILMASMLFALFLCLQYWQQNFFWVGHGTDQYAVSLIDYLNPQKFKVYPFRGIHHDETLYCYFLESLLPLEYDPILPMWITLAANKVAAMGIVFGSFRLFKISQALALTATLFLFFGSFLTPPFKYLLYFDSSSPLAYVVHSGRLVGIALTLFLVASIIRLGERALPKGALFIISAGLVLTSISNSLMLAICLPFALCLSARPKISGHKILAPMPLIQGALCSKAYQVGSVWSGGLIPTGAILFSSIPALLFSLWQFLKARCFGIEQAKLYGLYLAGLLFGCLFLGNVLADNPLTLALFSWAKQHHWIDMELELALPMSAIGSKFFVDAREIADYTQYCQGSARFWTFYGLFFCLNSLALYLVNRRRRLLRLELVSPWLLFLLALLPLLFFYADFMQPEQRAWVKLRFVEIPFYLGLASCLAVCFSLGARPFRQVLALLLLFHVAVPIWQTDRVYQWRDNFNALVALYRKSHP